MYKQYISVNGGDNFIIRLTDGAWIPVSDGNTNYQEYLAWLAEGNEPEPADEPEGETA
jgi:hypothetical protein